MQMTGSCGFQQPDLCSASNVTAVPFQNCSCQLVVVRASACQVRALESKKLPVENLHVSAKKGYCTINIMDPWASKLARKVTDKYN